MLKRIAALAAVFLVTEAPAFADWAGDLNLEAVAVEEADTRRVPVSVQDCEAHFRSLRARSDMRPSERERALEACLELARGGLVDERLVVWGD
jgi:hypothetical protein